MFREPEPVLPPGITPTPPTASAGAVDSKSKDMDMPLPNKLSVSAAHAAAAAAAAGPPIVFNSNELLTGSLACSATTYLLKLKFTGVAPGSLQAVDQSNTEFFDLLHAYLTHVEAQVHGGDIVWGLVPGYWVLVQSFVRRVLDLTASEYPYQLIACFKLLLHNPDLLTFFTRAVLGTTPSNDRLSINRALDLHDAWFRV